MPGAIDMHTHAFPDHIAARAIPALEKEGNITACLNGTVAALLSSMDLAGIERSVLCSIATRPEHFIPILEWSKTIRSDRIEPFPSLHPEDSQLLDHLQAIHSEGFIGVKMHSYYQNYFLDDRRLFVLYDLMSELGTILVIHAGYDIAYPRIRMADPQRILYISRQFPKLKLIATHLGGWDEWDAVRELLTGQPIYMELSFAFNSLSSERIRDIMLHHPAEYLLFGTDSPWTDQATGLEMLMRLGLPDDLLTKVIRTNALHLLKTNRQHSPLSTREAKQGAQPC
ncbi:MAG: amidohydrolase family protein [Desulfobulbus oligotrophicus]|jgi:predicted TIM-barrel fold metal-dependent hydrolase|nr:amidohydrolase family protein [Desulfobulbus oligotrophicus]